ncbi:hypothetical protein Sfulv_37490 [Streptomyces fulvorobeus]|uniref:Uncharacterized protein n=1 Tax=Streptomyces fulvorobeus TaxID=284028 RepID=A0A7J0C996_9ACTN|nr:hypothetical protein Sfulv_37490 [Streptomyces fulvorobeus]
MGVQADHEDMAEPALVRGVGGPEREVGGARRVVVEAGRGLPGERLGDIRGRQVVARLVGGGEQGVEIRVRAVGGQPQGPAVAAAALQKGGLGLRARCGVEAGEARGVVARRCGRRCGAPAPDRRGRPPGLPRSPRQAGVGLAGPGQRGLLGRTTSVPLEEGTEGNEVARVKEEKKVKGEADVPSR